ncbi:MAG TPA: PEP-utilizing enzyme, partial [Euzebya sp.]|nr:PEP-utilizing enzyme [Euzebya sp.]
ERPNDPVGALAAVDADLAEALEGWIARHAWRSMDYDPGRPVLAEQPAVIGRLLLADPTSPDRDGEGTRLATAHTHETQARASLDPADLPRFDRLLDDARGRYPIREDNVIWTEGLPGGLLRRWLLEAAGRLVDHGVLDQVDDGAYLTQPELVDALTGTGDPAQLMDRVVRRRGEEAYVRANPGPLTIGGGGEMPDLSWFPAPLRAVNQALLWFVGLEYPGAPEVGGDDDEVLLRGVPASGGVAEGPVRVIRRQTDFHRMQPGEVLVCTVTTPTWATMFGLATAVIADGGGALSHAAIAARENGLPAVLGTRTATTTLVDGQLVRVDGTAGTVRALTT